MFHCIRASDTVFGRLLAIPLFTCILENRYNHGMGAHRKTGRTIRRNSPLSRLLLLLATSSAIWWPQASHSSEKSASAQLLQSYFDTAGVCTTSSVDSIVETPEHLTVNIAIEKATAKALLGASSNLKDNWFSLHCPPEIHGLWRLPEPPDDVLISGALDDTKNHSLSCRAYRDREHARILTFRDRVRVALERLLNH
ncbi:MAG: hypothetical protein AB8B64_11455 [Granulosicoccus sp.]